MTAGRCLCLSNLQGALGQSWPVLCLVPEWRGQENVMKELLIVLTLYACWRIKANAAFQGLNDTKDGVANA